MVKVIGGAQEGEFKAVASGTLPNGKPVVVNADGTVSVVVGSSQTEALGTPVVFETSSQSEIENQASTYDSASGKVILAYKGNSSYGTAIVGTVSGTSISFGTAVVFNSNTTNWSSIDYDSNTGKVLIAYLNNSNNDGEAIVGTVSGTSISFGSPSAFYTGGGQASRIGCIYSSQSQKFGIFYGDTAGGSYPPSGKRVVATISGTSVSFGSTSTWYSTREVNLQKTCYDSTNNRFVTVFKAGTGISYAIAHSMSGTSFSTAISPTIIYDSNDTAEYSSIQQFAIAHDTDTGANLWIFRGGQDSGVQDYQAKVIKISGGSFSVGSKTQIQTGYTTYNGITYDSIAQKFVLAYISPTQGAGVYYRTATVSGTTPTFSDAVEFELGEGRSGTSVTSLGNGTVVISYVDDDNSDRGTSAVVQIGYNNTTLTSENYIGMSSGAVTPSVNGTKTSFNSSAIGSEVTGSVYDPDTGKIIICYTRGSDNHGLAVVGTVSGTTLSFGTPVVFNAAVTDHTDITYDTANNKVLIVYKNVGNNNYGTAIVGTVSGTSISFGTPVVYFSARSHNNKATFDTNAGKSLVVWLDDDNNDVESAVATISGTNVSFGSTVTVDANANSNEVVFDSNSNKVVVVYKDLGNSNYGTAIVGTISGTSVSFGSEVVFNPGSTSDIHCAFDSTNNKVIISFKAGSDGDKAKAIVGTVSGTAISFGSLATINDAASQQPKPVYNSVQQQLIFEYEISGNGLYYRTASVSGTSIVNIGAQVTLASGFDALVSNLVYHPTENVAVVGFKDSGDSNKGNAIAFSTEVRGEVASGGAATVDIIGSLSTNQGGLTAGQQYFVQTDGTIGTTPADPSVLAGTAISSSKLLVKT